MVEPKPLRQMTADQIASRIKNEADARLDEVIERLFSIVRNHHAHDAWRAECGCSYCDFIRKEYVPCKMIAHRLKKRVKYYDWLNAETDSQLGLATEEKLKVAQKRVWIMKEEKKRLKNDSF